MRPLHFGFILLIVVVCITTQIQWKILGQCPGENKMEMLLSLIFCGVVVKLMVLVLQNVSQSKNVSHIGETYLRVAGASRIQAPHSKQSADLD